MHLLYRSYMGVETPWWMCTWVASAQNYKYALLCQWWQTVCFYGDIHVIQVSVHLSQLRLLNHRSSMTDSSVTLKLRDTIGWIAVKFLIQMFMVPEVKMFICPYFGLLPNTAGYLQNIHHSHEWHVLTHQTQIANGSATIDQSND